jgi:uncharacterized protein (DUF433 family)
VRDLGDAVPGFESRPAVRGGAPCIVRTRIPVRVFEQSPRLGIGESELLRGYPSLRAEDLANAWAYVRRHRDEIDHQIRENEEARAVARRFADESFPFPVVDGLRILGHSNPNS